MFSARDSHKLTWSQIRNVNGAASDGGVFIDGPMPLGVPGPDGLVNTADDGAVETVLLPGRDQILNTSDDVTVTLGNYTREIMIRDVANENGQLRSIVVTITYQSGSSRRSYVLTSYISSYS